MNIKSYRKYVENICKDLSLIIHTLGKVLTKNNQFSFVNTKEFYLPVAKNKTTMDKQLSIANTLKQHMFAYNWSHVLKYKLKACIKGVSRSSSFRVGPTSQQHEDLFIPWISGSCSSKAKR